MRVVEIGIKTLYQVEGIEGSEWVREPVKGLKTYDAPQMKSGLSIKDKGCGSKCRLSLMYALCDSNTVQNGHQLTGFFSTTFSNGHGLSVMEGESWRRSIALYSARKLSKDTWVIHKDQYLVPSVYEEGGG